MNDVLNLELQAAGTSWTAGSSSKDAVISYVDGFQWAIYRNVLTDVLHWDFVRTSQPASTRAYAE